jgi:argininosuccinate lyase
MPQKRNPDVLELVRAKSASISADLAAITGVIRALPSGYNRDFQETKGPFFRGCESGLAILRVMDLTAAKLGVNPDKLRAGFTPEIFATDEALELAGKGVPFREAYREVGQHLDRLGKRDPVEAIARKTSTGATGNLRLDIPKQAVKVFSAEVQKDETFTRDRIAALAGREVELFRDPLR